MNEPCTYRDKYSLYLETTSLRVDKEAIKKLVAFAEEQIPAFLQNSGYTEIVAWYDNLELEFWASLSADNLPISTKEEQEYAAMVMTSVKYIKGFINFNKTADYKKVFADKLKREQKAAQRVKSEPLIDHTLPKEKDVARPEGTPTQVCVTHYERNPEDRRKVLERDGYECQVCHMKFIDTYGEIGKDYIEVHHLYPVCNMGEDYIFDPLDVEKGLVCLCSNCHSMIHRGGHYAEIDGEKKMIPLTLEALRKIYNERQNDRNPEA